VNGRGVKRSSLLLIPFTLLCLFVLGTGLIAPLLWWRLRPQPSPLSRTLFQGVTYQRLVRSWPRPMVLHVVTVDLRADGIRLLVTPGDPEKELPLKARTTTQFLEEFGVQIAVNGDGFTPWRSNTLLDYYPHPGDGVRPIGFAASQGVVYSQNTDNQPVLYFSRTNRARFGVPMGKIYHALSGNLMLVEQGRPVPGLEGEPQPRTTIGLDKNGNRLIILVVDGRQPHYSEGATLAEVAEALVALGAYQAMNLDGGGSSTLAMEKGGRAMLLNVPINHGIAGRQRPVGNHLGIYALPATPP